MGLLELFILAVGLSMDAFAVSICKGLSVGRVRPVHMLTAGLWFGGFQALMPFLGWLLGSQFEALITNIDHWIAFVLLVFIGGNMVKESRSEEEHQDGSFSPAAMLPLALATSIDALAVGISFAAVSANIWLSAGLIGVITFSLSYLGVFFGKRLGCAFQKKAVVTGGVVLILIGAKILLEHLGILG